MEYPLPIELAEFNYYEDKALVSIFFTFNFSDLQKGLANNYMILNKKQPNIYPKEEEYILRTNVLMYRLNDLLKDPEHQMYLHVLLKDIEQSEKQHKQEEQQDTHEIFIQEDQNYGNFKVVVNLNPMKNNAKQYTTRKIPLIQSSDLISERCYQAMIEVSDAILQIDLGEEDCTCMTAHSIQHFDPQLFELYLIFARHNKILDQINAIEQQMKEINEQSKQQKEVLMRNLLFKMNQHLKSLSDWRERTKENVIDELKVKFNTISEVILQKYESYTSTSVRSTQTVFEQQVGILLDNAQIREEKIKLASKEEKQPNQQLLDLKKKFLDQYAQEYAERYNIHTAVSLFVKSIHAAGAASLGCTGINDDRLVHGAFFSHGNTTQEGTTLGGHSSNAKSSKQAEKGKQLDQQQQLLQQQNYQICTNIIASNILNEVILLDKSIFKSQNIKLAHLYDILNKCNVKHIIELQKMHGVSFKDFKSDDIKEALYLVEFANRFQFDSNVKIENYIFPQEMLNQYVMEKYHDFSERINNLSLDQLYQLKDYEILFPELVQELKDQLLNNLHSTKTLTKQVTFSGDLDLDSANETTNSLSRQVTLLKKSPTQIYHNKAQLLIDQYGLDKLDIRTLKKQNKFPKGFKLISTKYGAYIDDCQVLFTGFDHDVKVCTDKVQISQNGVFKNRFLTFNFHVYNFKPEAKNVKLGFIFNGFFQILLSNDGIIQLTGNRKLEMDVCFLKMVTLKLNFDEECVSIITDCQQSGPKTIYFKDIFVLEKQSDDSKEFTNETQNNQHGVIQNMFYERKMFQEIVQRVQKDSKNQFRDEVSQQLYNCSIQVQMSVYQIKNCSKEDEYTFIQSIQL